MSTNFSGWCCCQEILIHDDKVFSANWGSGKPADPQDLQFALSFCESQHLAAWPVEDNKGKIPQREKKCGSPTKFQLRYYEAVLGRQPFL